LTALLGALERDEPPERAALRTLVELSRSRPHAAQLLLGEGLAVGPAGLRARDALVAEIARAISSRSPGHSAIDIPFDIFIGAAFRFITMSLPDGTAGEGLDEQMFAWADTFARRPGEPCWSAAITPALALGDSPPRDLPASRPPRRRAPVATPRERILAAAAASTAGAGYRNVAVTQIAGAAGVSRRTFYNEFSGKREAVTAACEHAFQQTLTACAAAFFDSHTWPERVWDSALAFARFFAGEPALARLGFVECHAVGRAMVLRLHEMQRAFTLFLEEGYRQGAHEESPPGACSALTVAAVAEAGFLASRSASSLDIRRMQPLAVYLVLAPFLEPEQAGRFVLARLSGRRDASARVREPQPMEGSRRRR
jgi:AcrR family transcriptional regulator